MQLWNHHCKLHTSNGTKGAELIIHQDRITIMCEKLKLFGLINDGYKEYLNIERDNDLKVSTIKRSGNKQYISLSTKEKRMAVEFEDEGTDMEKEIRSYLELAERISKPSRFTVDGAVGDYLRRTGTEAA